MTCPVCNGTGTVERVVWASPLGMFVETISETCSRCDGSGEIEEVEG